MIIRAKLSIGFPGAMQEDDIEIEDEELEGMTETQKEQYLDEQVGLWANQLIEYWYD